MNYLDYINQPILKAFFGNKMPTLGPNASEKDVKKFQDWAVDNGYMTQEQVNTGYGKYGPRTTAAYQKAVADQRSGSGSGSGSGFFSNLFQGNKMPKVNPKDPDSVKRFQDWAVRNNYMTQEQVNTGYGKYGPRTTAAYQKAMADQKGSSTSNSSTSKTKQPELVKPGVYYLSYPGHEINLKGQVTKDDYYAPLGHGGVVIVGNDGSVTQYDYGRYSESGVFGTRFKKNDGNWKSTERDALNLNSATYDQLLKRVADSGAHGSPNVRLTFAHNADPERVREAIMNDANAANRDVYGVGFVAKAKRDQLKDSDEGFLHRVREFGTTKGCAQSAHDAIQEGVPFWNKARGVAAQVMSIPLFSAISELTSGDRDGAGAWVGFSPRGAERSLQRQGYRTYDSDDYA